MTPHSAAGGLPQCKADLSTCNANLAACQAEPHAVFPGDGAGSGPALSYTDNGDGTATDNNTLLMWEVKNNVAGSVHNVNNPYTWSDSGSAADGTLFTVFLATLNNKCDGDESTACTSNTNCAGIGNGLCGHAGHRDWRIPNIKELQSIVDYGPFVLTIDPTFPGLTAEADHWSATSDAFNPGFAWRVFFGVGPGCIDGPISVDSHNKDDTLSARAVRGGS